MVSAGLLFLLIGVVGSQKNKEARLYTEISDEQLAYCRNSIQEQITLGEYHPSKQSHDFNGEAFSEPRLHFVNRAHNIRAYFDDRGIELLPRDTKGSGTWSARLSFPSMVGSSEPLIIENRIVYQHPLVTQEFNNSSAGIKQNMTIHDKMNASSAINFKVKLELDGMYCTHDTEDRLVFTNGDGEITFRDLGATDAREESLRTSISYGSEEISLTICDDRAVYPIRMSVLISSHGETDQPVISPAAPGLNQEPDWIAESNQPNAYFGISVASAGDVNNDGYDDVVIGAILYDNGQTNEGRAYVYHGGAAGLSMNPCWIVESNQANANFGAAVASAGDVNGDGYDDVIIGAHCFDNGEINEGRAYLYHGSALGLCPAPAWTAESNKSGARFGASVASAGDVNNDGYDDLIIGANFLENGQYHEGGAYVYHGGTAGLSASADWFVEGDWIQARLGTSVASAGDVNNDGYDDIIIGAPGFVFGQIEEGRAFVYHGSAAGLSLTPDWITESDCDSANYGTSVASAGDVNNDGYSDVIIGAPGFNNDQGNVGRVYVYYGGASGLSASADWTIESDQTDAHFGISVASAGDVNNDGYSDVIIGADRYDNGAENEGRAHICCSRSNGLPAFIDWTAEANQAGALFGSSVATAGDVNNDGYDDVIIGAYAYDNIQVNEGRAYAFHGRSALLHNIQAITLIEPTETRYEEFTVIQPSAVFRNRGFVDEDSVPVICIIRKGINTIYVSEKIIHPFIQNTDTMVVFDEFTLGFCGSHYEVFAFSCMPEDTLYADDTTLTRDFVAGRIYELPEPDCIAWKCPNIDTSLIPPPDDSNWIRATPTEIQHISSLDSAWWVTAGAIDSAHQDLQLYGFQLDVSDTLIEELTVEWWGHHGGPAHNQCVLYFWNCDSNVWSQRMDSLNLSGDARFVCDVPADSFGTFINSEGLFFVATAAQYFSCCPLLFAFNGQENVFIGDIITGCDLGVWIDRVMGCDLYVPPDYDEYVRISGDDLQEVDGRYCLTINEMLQEVSYLDETKLYVIDHPASYEVYPHEALVYPGYQGLNIHPSREAAPAAVTDMYGHDVQRTLEKEDRIYAPFERSGITGFPEPYTLTFDLGNLDDPGSAVLYLYGSTRFPDSRDIAPVSDIYQAYMEGIRLRQPRVEVVDGAGKWKKIQSCGVPRGHEKTVTYPLYDEKGNSIFASSDHRLRITFYNEVYLDKAWVSCCQSSDYRIYEIEPEVADLHYHGYAQYYSQDGIYPGDYHYAKKTDRDFADIAGYYTRYGDVKPLLGKADSRFVIMCHGDEIGLEFSADRLPELPEGWQRDFVFASKGFYKMARPGRAYAYSVDPLPFCGMRDDMSSNQVGYYPYDPSPGLFASLLGRIYGKIAFDYPFSVGDAFEIIRAHLTGKVKNKYPEELIEYCQEWNTRHVSAYYPDNYADTPPHLNIERVPLLETEGSWLNHLVSLSIPFGDHSLHSNYVRVWLLTTIPTAIKEEKSDVPLRFSVKGGNPNPFRRSTLINYTIPSRSPVCLQVYDLTGRLVRTIVNEVQLPGSYTVTWDGRDNLHRECPAGAYFMNMTAGTEFSQARKLLLVK